MYADVETALGGGRVELALLLLERTLLLLLLLMLDLALLLLLLNNPYHRLRSHHSRIHSRVLIVRILQHQHPLTPFVHIAPKPVLSNQIADGNSVPVRIEVLQKLGFRAMVPFAACAEPNGCPPGGGGVDMGADRERVDAQTAVCGDECGDVGVGGEDVGGAGGGCGVVGGAGGVGTEGGAEEEDWGGGGKHCGLFWGGRGKVVRVEMEMVWFWVGGGR